MRLPSECDGEMHDLSSRSKVSHGLAYGNMLSFGKCTLDFPFGKSSVTLRGVNHGGQTTKNEGGPATDRLSAHGLHAVLKGAWTPNVIWYLREEPRRFSELLADIPGVSPKVFSARLKRLERDGILTRQVMPTSPPTLAAEVPTAVLVRGLR